MTNQTTARFIFHGDVMAARQEFMRARHAIQGTVGRQFWKAWELLESSAFNDRFRSLERNVRLCRKAIGEPEDFGDDTPLSSSLRLVYQSWETLERIHSEELERILNNSRRVTTDRVNHVSAQRPALHHGASTASPAGDRPGPAE